MLPRSLGRLRPCALPASLLLNVDRQSAQWQEPNMRIKALRKTKHSQSNVAFTLLEVLIGVVVIGGMTLSLYVGMTQGFAVIQLARENLRATQILQEKTEAVRLLNWDELNTPGEVPATFTAPFYAADAKVDSTDDPSLIYRGLVTITNAPIYYPEYSSDLRLVEVEVMWMSGDIQRRRSMRTLVSKFGLQNYIMYDN